jgi:hypothetical protein
VTKGNPTGSIFIYTEGNRKILRAKERRSGWQKRSDQAEREAQSWVETT